MRVTLQTINLLIGSIFELSIINHCWSKAICTRYFMSFRSRYFSRLSIFPHDHDNHRSLYPPSILYQLARRAPFTPRTTYTQTATEVYCVERRVCDLNFCLLFDNSFPRTKYKLASIPSFICVRVWERCVIDLTCLL